MLLHSSLLRCILIATSSYVASRTISDSIKELEKGSTKIILGAFAGDISLIRRGIEEGGVINAVMDPFVGTSFKK
jgi:uncharacterized membrane protein